MLRVMPPDYRLAPSLPGSKLFRRSRPLSLANYKFRPLNGEVTSGSASSRIRIGSFIGSSMRGRVLVAPAFLLAAHGVAIGTFREHSRKDYLPGGGSPDFSARIAS